MLGPTTAKRTVKTKVVGEGPDHHRHRRPHPGAHVRSVKKVPLLGDIAVLGLAVPRHGDTTKTKTNLLLFLTPYIIRDESDYRRIYERKRKEQQEFIEQFYGRSPQYEVASTSRARRARSPSCARASSTSPQARERRHGPAPGERVTIPPPAAAPAAGRAARASPRPRPVARGRDARRSPRRPAGRAASGRRAPGAALRGAPRGAAHPAARRASARRPAVGAPPGAARGAPPPGAPPQRE